MTKLSLNLDVDLLALPASKLLDRFASGEPTPGSGSAAALQGAICCALIRTSAQLTISKVSDSRRVAEADFVLKTIKSFDKKIRKLVQEDKTIFDRVIVERKLRDASTDPRKRSACNKRLRRRLDKATDAAVAIARMCNDIANLGMNMLRIGYKAAIGDPVAGITAALAGAQGAAVAALVNIKASKGGMHAQKSMVAVKKILFEAAAIHANVIKFVLGLEVEAFSIVGDKGDQLDLL